MTDKTLHQKIDIDLDLSELGLERALEIFGSDPPRYIICHPDNGVMAGRLAQMKNLAVISLPNLKEYSWAIIGDYTVVWSDGA